MSQHIIAFRSNVLTAGTLQAIGPVPDATVTIGSANVYVPAKYNKVLYAAGWNDNANQTRQQLRAPSLRELFYPEITPYDDRNSFLGGNFFSDFAENPIQLETNEGLNFFSDGGGDGTTAQGVQGIVILGDASPAVQKGKIMSMYATTAIAASNTAWANGAITFDQTLPVGKYDIVGMRVNAASALAARLIFIGASAITRPGVFCTDTVFREDFPRFRMGNNGLLGTFDTTNPPSLEIFGGSTTSQTLVLDLIKRS